MRSWRLLLLLHLQSADLVERTDLEERIFSETRHVCDVKLSWVLGFRRSVGGFGDRSESGLVEVIQRSFPAPLLLGRVLVCEGGPAFGAHQGQGEGSGGLGDAMRQYHVAVYVAGVGELTGALATLEGSRVRQRSVLLHVHL